MMLLLCMLLLTQQRHHCCGASAVELVHQHPSTSLVGASSSVSRGNVAELLPLRLHYKVPWPLSMIVDDAMLLKYNQALTFLLQASFQFFEHHA